MFYICVTEAGKLLNLPFCVEYAAERKVSFSYLMNRCLHNTAHPTDGSIISSHYGGLQEGRDLCGRTERLTSSPPDRTHGGPLTRVVLPEKPKVGFPFHEVSSWCAGNPETCVKGSGCQGPLSGHSSIGTMSRRHSYCLEGFFMKRFYKTEYFTNYGLLLTCALCSNYYFFSALSIT